MSRISKDDQLPSHLVDVEFIQEVIPDMVIDGIESPYRLFRYDKAEDRYYYRFVGGEAIGYLSMTSYAGMALPTSKFLIDWIADNGQEQSEYIKNERANYGTLTHVILTEIGRSRQGSFDEIKRRAFEEAISLGYKYEAVEWQEGVLNDVISFLFFLKERNAKIIAAEFPICSDKYGLGGCIDWVLEFDFGRNTRVNAILDYKSGRKGFYDSHIFQLHGYKTVWNDIYGDIFPVTHVFNIAPVKNAKTAKTKYKLKNQTDETLSGETVPVKEWIEDQLLMAKKRGLVRPPVSHFDVTGEFDLDTFDINNHIVETKI